MVNGKCGRLSVRVEKAGDWRVDFVAGGKTITGSGWRGDSLLVGVQAAGAKEGGQAERCALGVVIRAEEGAGEIRVRMDG